MKGKKWKGLLKKMWGKNVLYRGEERLSGEKEKNVQNSGGMAEGITLTEKRLRELESKRAEDRVKDKIWT